MWVAHELSEPRAQAAQAYLKGVQETLKALLKLKGVEPLLMFSPHVNGWDPVERSRRVAQNAQGVEELIGALRVPLAPVEAWVATFERPMMAWLKEAQSSPDHARLTLFESRPLLCPAARGWCEALSRDDVGRAQLWFSDSNHLSQAGAERLARALTDELLERRDRDK